MSTKKLVVANWKQNKTLDEAVAWAREFVGLCAGTSGVVLPVVCPPTPFLPELAGVLRPAGVALGLQDVSPFSDGAHTGYVGVNQVKDMVNYAIVGHSERGEDREVVVQKASTCLQAGITPIVCFKSLDQYKKIEGAVYALEDPENISQGGIYRPKVLTEVEELLVKARTFFGNESKILYGGSVNDQNAEELASIPELDGVLVGNASLNPRTFCAIVNKL